MKIVFVCSANCNRSPTFERLFKSEFPQGFEVRSAGCWYGYPYKVDDGLLSWADTVYVMDLSHKRFIYQKYPDHFHKVQLIGISDQYDVDSPELCDLFYYWVGVEMKWFVEDGNTEEKHSKDTHLESNS